MAVAHLGDDQFEVGGVSVTSEAKRRVVRHDHKLAGTVTVQGNPAIREVRVYAPSGRLLRRTQSASDGSWSVKHLQSARYLILARDRRPEPQFGAVAADFVASVPEV